MRRTRRLILVLIALIAVAVGITWSIQKSSQARQAPAPPPKLPESVSARAANWTWEETRDGRPVVRVWARDFKQNATNNTIELQDVELHLFHADGKTYDKVKSARADFNRTDSTMFSEGEVEITTGMPADPNAKPSARLVTIKTSGVRFESGSGKATTDRPATFLFDRGEGRCTGASYDPAARELLMQKDVFLIWRGETPGTKPMEVEAGSLLYKEVESKIFLMDWSKFRRDTLSMVGGNSVVSLKEGAIQEVDSLTAKGTDKRPKQQIDFAADHLFIRFGDSNALSSVTGDGNAKLRSTTAGSVTDTASSRVDLEFTVEKEDSVLKKALATGDARVESAPIIKPGVPPGDTRIMTSNVIVVYMRPGREEIEKVETEAPGAIEFRPNRPGQKHRFVNGERMSAVYAAGNQLQAFSAYSVTTRSESEPVKGKPQPLVLTSSRNMAAQFEPKTGIMTRLEQWDDFKYEEGDRRAVSEKAELHNPSEEVFLRGKARMWDPTGSTSADEIILRQKTGEFEAAGNVNSTRQPEKKKDAKSTGMLGGEEPLQAKAAKMTSSDSNTRIVYEGKALLWQGPNRIEAERVLIDRKSDRLTATGNVMTQLLEKADPKAKEKTARLFTIVRSQAMTYDDKQRLAHYTGGAKLDRGVMVVTAREIRAFLKSGEADSSLDHAFADGGVKIVQTTPERTRTGTSEHAEYWPDDGKVILSGGQPEFFDSRDGRTRGRQLTYFTGKEHLIVEGEQGNRVQSRIPKRSR
jgi:lipopolysaccharide export system protein LptA